MKKGIKYFLLLLVLSLSAPVMQPLQAQCPMCKMSAESNLKQGGTAGKGLNRGILYMLTMPYLIVGTLGFVWYKNKKQNQEEAPSDPQLN